VKYPENKCGHCVYLGEGLTGLLYFHPGGVTHVSPNGGWGYSEDRLLCVLESHYTSRAWELDNGETAVISKCGNHNMRKDLTLALGLAVKRGLISKPEADRNY
jgi:hypothetical protein